MWDLITHTTIHAQLISNQSRASQSRASQSLPLIPNIIIRESLFCGVISSNRLRVIGLPLIPFYCHTPNPKSRLVK